MKGQGGPATGARCMNEMARVAGRQHALRPATLRPSICCLGTRTGLFHAHVWYTTGQKTPDSVPAGPPCARAGLSDSDIQHSSAITRVLEHQANIRLMISWCVLTSACLGVQRLFSRCSSHRPSIQIRRRCWWKAVRPRPRPRPHATPTGRESGRNGGMLKSSALYTLIQLPWQKRRRSYDSVGKQFAHNRVQRLGDQATCQREVTKSCTHLRLPQRASRW